MTVTDLHSCCKCKVYQDVDTLRMYTKSKDTEVLQMGMICRDCRNLLIENKQLIEIDLLGLKYTIES